MKKTITLFAALALFSAPLISLADTTCYNSVNEPMTSCGAGPDVTQLMMPWGLKAADTPIVKSGSFSDRYGNVFTVHIWDGPNGVYNIFDTPYYLSQVHGFLNIK